MIVDSFVMLFNELCSFGLKFKGVSSISAPADISKKEVAKGTSLRSIIVRTVAGKCSIKAARFCNHPIYPYALAYNVSWMSSPLIASCTLAPMLTFSCPSPRTLPSGSASTFAPGACDSASALESCVANPECPTTLGCRLPLSAFFFSFFGGGG